MITLTIDSQRCDLADGCSIEGLGCFYLSKIFALSVCVYIVFDETLIHSTIYFRQKYEIKER